MNTNLTAAKAAKKDEFFTRLEDIEAELKHYPDALNAVTHKQVFPLIKLGKVWGSWGPRHRC